MNMMAECEECKQNDRRTQCGYSPTATPMEAQQHLRSGGRVQVHGGRADGNEYELVDGKLMYRAPRIVMSEQRVSECNHNPSETWFASPQITNIELLPGRADGARGQTAPEPSAEDARTQQVILRLAAMSDKWERVQQAILDELLLAVSHYNSMANPHDGWARIREEVDELWDEVKTREQPVERMRAEAIQVGAMAMRFILDVCGGVE